MPKQVRVEIGPNGLPCRIFRDHSWKTCENEVQVMDRGKAVGSIRAQVFDRATGDSPAGGETSECERCGRYIRWDTFEMHETLPKGKGGEVSVQNCEALCRDCHQTGADAAHADRRWQTSKSSPKGQND